MPEVGSESFANNTLWAFRVFNFTGARENNEIIKGSSDIFYIDDLSIKLDAVEGTITNSAELDKNAGKVKAFVWKSMEDMLPIHKGEEIIMSDEE